MISTKIADWLVALGSGTTYTRWERDHRGFDLYARAPLWLRRAYVLTLPVSLPLLLAALVLCLVGMVAEVVIWPTANAIKNNWREYE